MRETIRLLKSKRGISTVVGATLAIVILVTFFSGVYLWTAQVKREMDQLDSDRTDESIVVHATFNYTEGDSVDMTDVNITVENTGTVDSELTRVWIIDKDNNEHYSQDVARNLPQRTSIFLTETDLNYTFNVTASTYYIKAVTTRGNMKGSSLEPADILETSYPVAIISEASNIKMTDDNVHLVAWSSLSNQTITSIVITNSSSVSEVINLQSYGDWELTEKMIKYKTFESLPSELTVIAMSVDETVRVELVNSSGQIVAACYLKVEE